MIDLSLASSILQKIDKIQQSCPEPKILSIIDCSRGVDQQVKIINYAPTASIKNRSKKHKFNSVNSVIIKYPKSEPDKILHEIVGCQLSRKCGVPVPEVLYSDHNFLVQTFIEGQILSSIVNQLKKKDEKNIYLSLGSYLSKIHSNKGKGYGKIKSKSLKGEHNNQNYILDSMKAQLNVLKQKNHYSSSFIQKVGMYILENSDLLTQSSATSLLHGDYCEDNILAKLTHVTGIVDFGDLALGNPMEDFSRLYIKHYGTDKWHYITEGYGQIQLKLIEFYTVYFCLWRINGLLENGKLWGTLRKLQKVLKNIL